MGRITETVLGAVEKIYAFRKSFMQIAARYKTSTEIFDIRTPAGLAKFMNALSGGDTTKLTKPYQQISTINACIQSKARNIAHIPFKIVKAGTEKEIKSGPIVDLFKSPNPYMTMTEIMEGLVITLDSKGEFFVLPDGMDIARIPLFMWLINPDDVKENQDGNGAFIGWKVKIGKNYFPYEYEQLIHGKYFNPDDMRRGLSAFKALSQSLDIRWNAMRYTSKFFENDATPSFTLETEKVLDKQQVDEINDVLINKRQGVDKSHRGLLLHSGLSAKTISASNRDIQLLETLNMSDVEICGVLGVPQSELQKRNDLNYATALSEDLGYWKKTLIPLSARIVDAFNIFFRKIGYEILADYKQIDALNREIIEKANVVKILWETKQFTMNEINDRLGLGFEEVPERDEFPTSSVPTQLASPSNPSGPVKSEPIEPPKEPAPEPSNDKKVKTVEELRALRGAKWRALDEQLAPVTSKCKNAIVRYFKSAKRGIKKNFSKTVTKTISYDDLIAGIDDEKFRKYVKQWFVKALDTGVDSVGVAWNMVDDQAEYYLGKRLKEITEINDTVRDQLREVLRESMTAADGEGRALSEAETAALLESKVDKVFEDAVHRAKTIARTEIHGAYSDGRYEAMRETQPYAKQWITSNDPLVRDSHYAIDGEVRLWNDSFSNGLDRPYDPNGEAKEVINCRCKLVAIYDKDEAVQYGL